MQFILSNWPLWFICVAMVAAAVIDGWKLKVPNWLTFPLVLSGTALGFVLLFPVYAIGGMGGGDVKMQMGFGAWIGAFYGLSASKVDPVHGGAMWIIFMAFVYAALIGGAIALGMI